MQLLDKLLNGIRKGCSSVAKFIESTGGTVTYQITKYGKIFSHNNRTGKTTELKFRKSPNGYLKVNLMIGSVDKNKGHRTYGVHTLVARAYIPNPSNYSYIHHKDGNRSNNFVGNLEWVPTKAVSV